MILVGVTPRSTIDLIIAQTAIDNNLLLFHNDKDICPNISSESKFETFVK